MNDPFFVLNMGPEPLRELQDEASNSGVCHSVGLAPRATSLLQQLRCLLLERAVLDRQAFERLPPVAELRGEASKENGLPPEMHDAISN